VARLGSTACDGPPRAPGLTYAPAVTTQIVLLRGINIGAKRRVAMPALRELLADGGFGDVRSYVQSGNVVLASRKAPTRVGVECERLISAAFGFQVDIVVRTRDELAEVVARNPLAEVATDPKRYQVSFLAAALPEPMIDRLSELAHESERIVAIDREVYVWHPDGVARSKLSNKLAGQGLGVTATARNWTTVTTLLAMADE
jgi:uncharacterized protein (DUF1697 family)